MTKSWESWWTSRREKRNSKWCTHAYFLLSPFSGYFGVNNTECTLEKWDLTFLQRHYIASEKIIVWIYTVIRKGMIIMQVHTRFFWQIWKIQETCEGHWKIIIVPTPAWLDTINRYTFFLIKNNVEFFWYGFNPSVITRNSKNPCVHLRNRFQDDWM